MAVTPEMILQVRYEIGDNLDPALPILSDVEIEYFLTKNNESIIRASVDCARVVLFKLSMQGNDTTVDVLSIKGSKAAQAYKQALELFIKDPKLNGLMNNIQMYIGNTSIADMAANNQNLDNPVVKPPVPERRTIPQQETDLLNPFSI